MPMRNKLLAQKYALFSYNTPTCGFLGSTVEATAASLIGARPSQSETDIYKEKRVLNLFPVYLAAFAQYAVIDLNRSLGNSVPVVFFTHEVIGLNGPHRRFLRLAERLQDAPGQ